MLLQTGTQFFQLFSKSEIAAFCRMRPVGKVSFLPLYPLSFMEFLNAMENGPLNTPLGEKNNFEAIPEVLHEKLTGLLKTYLYLGGMPEVIRTWLFQTNAIKVEKLAIKDFCPNYLKFVYINKQNLFGGGKTSLKKSNKENFEVECLLLIHHLVAP